MKYSLNLTSRAKRDVQIILRYIAARSKTGAEAWYRRLSKVFDELRQSPESFGFAPEDADHAETIRQAVFKTRHGLPYRALFVMRNDLIFVIHVRGSGQD